MENFNYENISKFTSENLNKEAIAKKIEDYLKTKKKK